LYSPDWITISEQSPMGSIK
jgi:hypothetical protein